MAKVLSTVFNKLKTKLEARREKRWIADIASGKRPVIEVRPFTLTPQKDNEFYMQSETRTQKGDAVAIASKTGATVLLKATDDAAYYNDFGFACYSAHLHNTNRTIDLAKLKEAQARKPKI